MKHIGTVIWFGPEKPWGFVGYGLFTNNTYEGQIFAHYKHMLPDGQRDKRFLKIEQNDIVEFEISEGHGGKGTQAINLRIIKLAENETNDGWVATASLQA